MRSMRGMRGRRSRMSWTRRLVYLGIAVGFVVLLCVSFHAWQIHHNPSSQLNKRNGSDSTGAGEMTFQPSIRPSHRHSWKTVFYDDFTSPEYNLDVNFRHPMGQAKWKWDPTTTKEIWWEPACSYIVPDTTRASKPILRVSVFSDWFHRIDRLATTREFGYGYYEARIRFRGASGMHSAFWLLPRVVEENPVAAGEIVGGVEIDVVEHRMVDTWGNALSTQGNIAVHWGGYGNHHKSVAFTVMVLPDEPWQWATFGVWHFEGGIRWFWNDVEVKSARVWSPVKNSIYFSTEVGQSHGWAGPDMLSYGTVDTPQGYIEIDYCGFWEEEDAPGIH